MLRNLLILPKQYLLITAFGLGCSVNIQAQQVITLKPGPSDGQDVMLKSHDPNTNHGGTGDFAAWDWTFSGLEGQGRGLIKFDLSALPSGAVVTDARLSLFYNTVSNSNGHSGDNESTLKIVTENWNSSTVTWNTKPATTSNGTITLQTSISETQDYGNIDVTDFVTNALANPSAYFGWELALVSPQLYKSLLFASSDNPIPALRPELNITYSTTSSVAGALKASDKWSLFSDNSVLIATKKGAGQEQIPYQIVSVDGRQIASGTFTSGTSIETNACYSAGIYVLYFIDNNQPVSLRFVK